MKPPVPSLTPTWHNDTYSAIDPTRPDLSAAGKTVIITGAGTGIGRAIAIAFADARAKHVALIGRTASTLEATAQMVSSKTQASVHPASILDEAKLRDIAKLIGPWDVLILNAGRTSTPASIRDSDIDEWWSTIETSVKGTLMTCRAFAPTASQNNAAVLNVSAGLICLPRQASATHSAYTVAKIAQLTFMEIFKEENPHLFFVSFHPGIVVTPLTEKSGVAKWPIQHDTPELAGHFAVWLASEQARFLQRRFVWANWDVDELKSKAAEIQSDPIFLTSNVLGWPHPPGA